MALKKTVTLTALLSFIALITGAVIAVCFRLWERLAVFHISLSILFGICYIIQTALEIRKENANNRISGKKRKWLTVNSGTAILLTGWVILGSLLNWPPFSALQPLTNPAQTESELQKLAEAEAPEKESRKEKLELPAKPPRFYSGTPLSSLCKKYSLDTEKIVEKLYKIGIEANPDWSIYKIGQQNDMKSAAVYDAIYRVK